MALNVYHNGLVFWTHEGKRYCLHVQQDSDVDNPREADGNTAVLYCSRKSLGDKNLCKSAGAFWHNLIIETIPKAELVSDLKNRLKAAQPKAVHQYMVESELNQNSDDDILEALESVVYGDESVATAMELLKNHASWLPVWGYEHSGLTISCGERVYPYNDRWDSGQLGWIVITKKDAMEKLGACEADWEEKADACMKAEIQTYDQYLTGEVYGFILREAESDDPADDEADWNELDSCWGFYGSDIIASGMAETVEHGLLQAIESGQYKTGEAQSYTTQHYRFVES